MTPIFSIPSVQTSIISFTLLNIILRHYEQLGLRTVIDTLATPPGSPADGDAYIVADTGTTGVFVGHENDIAFSIQGAWYFLEQGAQTEGYYVDVINTRQRAVFDGTGWVYTVSDQINAIASATSISFDLVKNNVIDATATTLTFTANLPLPVGEVLIVNDGANDFDVDLDGTTVTITTATSERFLITGSQIIQL